MHAADVMLVAVRLEDILPSSGHNIWLHGAAGGDSCSFLRSPVRQVMPSGSCSCSSVRVGLLSQEDDLWERRLAQLGSAAGRAGVPGKSLQELLLWPCCGPISYSVLQCALRKDFETPKLHSGH